MIKACGCICVHVCVNGVGCGEHSFRMFHQSEQQNMLIWLNFQRASPRQNTLKITTIFKGLMKEESARQHLLALRLGALIQVSLPDSHIGG